MTARKDTAEIVELRKRFVRLEEAVRLNLPFGAFEMGYHRELRAALEAFRTEFRAQIGYSADE